MSRIQPHTRTAARRLRAAMTPQERCLWWHLRELNRMLGTNFRRQAPVGDFIVDFADLGRRLVIEVDGSQHGQDDGQARDADRDAWLAGQGFTVLRVWNTDVSRNIEGVMQVVLDTLGIDPVAPPPHPSPTRGEGGARRSVSGATGGPGASPPPRGEGPGVGGAAAGGTIP